MKVTIKEGSCPYCGATTNIFWQIYHEDSEFQENRGHCRNCNNKFVEVFTITFLGTRLQKTGQDFGEYLDEGEHTIE